MQNPELSEQRRDVIFASFAKQGFLIGLAARISHLGKGRCSIEMPFSASVAQQHNFFHGGAVGALADSAGGYAAMTIVPDGSDVLTLEYKINFLRPAVGSLLVAEGIVLRAGRSVVVTRIDVFSCEGEKRTLCAAVQQSVVPHLAHPE